MLRQNNKIHFHVNKTLKYICSLFIYFITWYLSVRMHRTNHCHFNKKGTTLSLENAPKEAIFMSDMPPWSHLIAYLTALKWSPLRRSLKWRIFSIFRPHLPLIALVWCKFGFHIVTSHIRISYLSLFSAEEGAFLKPVFKNGKVFLLYLNLQNFFNNLAINVHDKDMCKNKKITNML